MKTLLNIYQFFGFPPIECQESTFYIILIGYGIIFLIIYYLSNKKKK